MTKLDRFAITMKARKLAMLVREEKKMGLPHTETVKALWLCRGQLDICRPDYAAAALRAAQLAYNIEWSNNPSDLPLLDYRKVKF